MNPISFKKDVYEHAAVFGTEYTSCIDLFGDG